MKKIHILYLVNKTWLFIIVSHSNPINNNARVKFFGVVGVVWCQTMKRDRKSIKNEENCKLREISVRRFYCHIFYKCNFMLNSLFYSFIVNVMSPATDIKRSWVKLKRKRERYSLSLKKQESKAFTNRFEMLSDMLFCIVFLLWKLLSTGKLL